MATRKTIEEVKNQTIKIVSDGRSMFSQVLLEDGSRVANLQKITWEVGIDNPVAKATIHFMDVPADVNVGLGESDVVIVPTEYCGHCLHCQAHEEAEAANG